MRTIQFILILVAAALVLAGNVPCNPQLTVGDGGSPGQPPAGPRVSFGFDWSHSYGGGTYGMEMNYVGHIGQAPPGGYCPYPSAIDPSQCRLLDHSWLEAKITETCVPLNQVDANSFGEQIASPVTTYLQGGYATGPFDCLLGQWLLFEVRVEQANQNPAVDETYADAECELLSHPSNQAGC